MTDFSGFYKLSIKERLERLKKGTGLTEEAAKTLLNSGAMDMERADRWIENVIGAIHLPLGVATHFVINGREMVIPMALEEPSVVAAASRAAKQTLPNGFTADADEPVMTGQLQIVGIEDTDHAIKQLNKHKKEVLEAGSEFVKNLEKFGGGLRDFTTRVLETPRQKMLLVEFHIDVRDAMGANMVNTLLEGVTPTVLKHTGGKNRLRIISNLATRRKVRARAVWKKDIVGEEVIEGVLDAYEFAKADIYRCSTHNKGIMNGIDAVVLATGNDWRAVEAGAHAYASMNGYHPLTAYKKMSNGDIEGSIELPLAIATIGGAVNTNPVAQITLKIAGVKTSKELAMACACVGLANNFAALSALSTVGIQKGHMKLHARNTAVLAGAETSEEIDAVAEKLAEKGDFTSDYAKEILRKIRGGHD